MKQTTKHISIWGDPNSKLPSQYGNVTYREWCQQEAQRINKSGGSAFVEELNGEVCVASGTKPN